MENNLEIFNEIDRILMEEETPSVNLNNLLNNEMLRITHPFNMILKLIETEQNLKYHPEGSVWNHTLMVVDQCAKRRRKSKAPRAFMWTALLHDIGKGPTTKIRKGKITSYNHDTVGARMAKEFLEEFHCSEDFVDNVSKMVRWHMQTLFVVKGLPFADLDSMVKEVDTEEIALFSLCDRLGRGEMTKEKEEDERKSVELFKNKASQIINVAVAFLIFTFAFISNATTTKVFALAKEDYKANMKRDILTIMMAYPGYVEDIIVEGDKVYLKMKSGKKIIYDDKKNKTSVEKENNGDIQDMLEQAYPLEAIDKLMDKEQNPGRVRVYSLLSEVYGSNRSEVEKNLTAVKGYNNLRFNNSNNAALNLGKAFNEVKTAVKSNNKIAAFVYPVNGTFNYRNISGTGRLSPHAYGIAIDLKSDKRDYWKWASREAGEQRIKEYSKDLVKIFENNNFIWGGKWGCFDILHFEYRPEIIIKAKYFSTSQQQESPWYNNVDVNDEMIKNYIELIDKRIS